jgi:hypothetical protein
MCLWGEAEARVSHSELEQDKCPNNGRQSESPAFAGLRSLVSVASAPDGTTWAERAGLAAASFSAA